MSQHTPGPWERRWDGDDHIGRKVKTRRGAMIFSSLATVCLPGTRDEQGHRSYEDLSAERSANARLIAAAPELLAACREALDYVAKPGDDDFGPEAERIRGQITAALAKATGEAAP